METIVRRGYSEVNDLTTLVTDNDKDCITVKRSDGKEEKLYYHEQSTKLSALGAACGIAAAWEKYRPESIKLFNI